MAGKSEGAANPVAGKGTVHWETGSAHNALCDWEPTGDGSFHKRGEDAPSEALLFGVSGGVMVGYFSFAYQGSDPHVALLGRNTFQPWEKIMSRLGVVQDVIQSTSFGRAISKLRESLEGGAAPVLFLDLYSLSHNGLSRPEDMWQVFPVTAISFDSREETLLVADRSTRLISVQKKELEEAWGRVKKNRYRMELLDCPGGGFPGSAVSQGIAEALELYFDGPPGRVPKSNVGASMFKHLVELLTKRTHRQSWQKVFGPGRPMFAGLLSLYGDVAGPNGIQAAAADRELYAEFLLEASEAQGRAVFREAAERFRQSAAEWRELGMLVLPEAVEPFAQARRILDRRRRIFYEAGDGAREEMHASWQELTALKDSPELPRENRWAEDFRSTLAEGVKRVGEVEQVAYEALREAVN